MAKLAVDRLVERDGRTAPCRTHEIPLGQPVDPGELLRVEGVTDDAYEALAGRYGYAAERVLKTASERGELAQPIIEGLPDLLAEAPHAAREEQARTVGDVLLRRTRLGLLAGRALTAPDDPGTAPRRAGARRRARLGRAASEPGGGALPRGGGGRGHRRARRVRSARMDELLELCRRVLGDGERAEESCRRGRSHADERPDRAARGRGTGVPRVRRGERCPARARTRARRAGAGRACRRSGA